MIDRIAKNYRGINPTSYRTRYNEKAFLGKLNEILYDDKITESEAKYIREMFEELQRFGREDLENLLDGYGIHREEYFVVPKSNIHKQRQIFFLIVAPAILIVLAKLLLW